MAERRSILDDIAADARTLDRRLGTGDQRKMDEYLSSVRETEKQVERLQSWIDRPKAAKMRNRRMPATVPAP